MRHLFVAATCAAILLCVAPASLALGAATPAPVPTGTGIVNLNISTFAGGPEVNASVLCVVDEGWAWYPGPDAPLWTPTDASGNVTFGNVPAGVDGNAHIVVRTASAPEDYYKLKNMSWPAAGFTASLRPGHLPLTITRTDDSEWGSWCSVTTLLWTGKQNEEQHIARTTVAGPREMNIVQGAANTIGLCPEILDGGTLYFWQDQGMILPVAGTSVWPGPPEANPVTVDQADAQRVWLDRWGSGKPGTRTRLRLDNYPEGWTNAIKGQADYPKNAPVSDFGTVTTIGGTGTWAALTIPRSVPPGYKYYVWADRTDFPFGLVTSFQTCTLTPSRQAVVRGRTVTLSGVVPVQGHRGSTKGSPKWVTVYRTTSAKVAAKGQPSVRGGATTPSGWKKIATVRANGLGKYRKESVKVSRTSWYCTWYPSDAWYSGGWTSVAKVRVR